MNKMILICLGAVSIGFLMIFFSKTLIFKSESQSTLVAQNYPTSSLTPTEAPLLSPTESITPKTQVLKATYSQGVGVSPTKFTVEKGIPVRLEVFAEIDGFGCMGSIMIPSFYSGIQEFVKGQTNVFEFIPDKPGEYEITCAMGIPHGSIVVN